MPALRRLLAVAASLRTTLWLFGLLALAVGYFYLSGRTGSEAWLAVPLFLLAANLLAAILTKPAFRKKGTLLAFHLGLLALLILIGIGRLTYLRGEVEVTEGEAMPPQLTRYRAGALHQFDEQAFGFTLERFDIEFDPNQYKRYIHSYVRWTDKAGKPVRYTIRDLAPLIQAGYRFYSTKHKGFAPVFLWQPAGGGPGQTGAIHLPAYPEHEHNQALEWALPGGTRVWAMLQFDEAIIVPGKVSKFHLPKQHLLVIRSGGKRVELHPGESVQLPGGTLTYQELRSWMGFVVFYDWTIPWLLAIAFFCVASLGWHYWRRCQAHPWLAQLSDDREDTRQ